MSRMDKLNAAVKNAKKSGGDREDEYFYYPARDVAGNGSAVIRFLSENDDDVVFVKVYSHGFKGPTGKWLIENCPTTLENECPICTANGKLYSTMSKEDARKFGMNRKTKFFSRILVIEDKKNPENEGKQFMFSYGSIIFDKIADKLSPAFEDELACDIFSMEEGANFKLKIRKLDGQTNYDKSEFDTPSVCDFKAVFNTENDIKKYLNPELFKDSVKLQTRLDFVNGNTTRVPAEKPAPKSYMESTGDDVPDNVEPKKVSKRTEVAKASRDDENLDDDILNILNDMDK